MYFFNIFAHTIDIFSMEYDEALITYYMGLLARDDQAKSAPLLQKASRMMEAAGVKFSTQL